MKKKMEKIVLVINPFFNIDQTIIFSELTFHNVYSSKYKDCIVTHPISQILTFTKFRLEIDTSLLLIVASILIMKQHKNRRHYD